MADDEASPEGPKTPRTADTPDDEDDVAALVSRITSNGTTREAMTPRSSIGAWSADRILHLETVVQLEDAPGADSGSAGGLAECDTTKGSEGEQAGEAFELWLGSLEDALSLRRLVDNGINAILNCALESCETEIAPFKPVGRGRPRSHTRSMSLSDEGDDTGRGLLHLHRDQVWSQAEFDGFWYSEALGYDVAYHAFSAEDEASYDVRQHFDEATAFLDNCRREGRRTLVHCVMGLNRAPAAATAFLCQGLGYALEDSIDLVSRHRGLVLSNGGFLNTLVATYGSKRTRTNTAVSIGSAVGSVGSGI